MIMENSEAVSDDPLTSQQYEASKPFTTGGVAYNRGDTVDTSNLTRFKIGQLLNQRYINPRTQPPG